MTLFLGAGTELLMLDPQGLYLPDGEESVCANLYNRDGAHYFDAHVSWPGTVAPFEALAAACLDTVSPLELPQGEPPGGHSHAASAKSQMPCNAAAAGFPGSLFRLPLRTEATAARSEVCSHPMSSERVQALLQEFAAAAPQMLLYTRHVREITVLLVKSHSSEATLLGRNG